MLSRTAKSKHFCNSFVFPSFESTFVCYGEDAISVRLGSTLPIERCRRFPSPKNEPRAWTYLCIEEPFDHTNTARSVYDQEKFEHIRKVFAVSYQRLHDTLSLDSIFHLRVA
ncbi:Zinc finger, CCHC domain-containing protein [Homalodisca vitripennis]|nr:Zinc finger, CCHC domain-containing protein [Homalodisca vitripennis]